jgi:hypothetical protein
VGRGVWREGGARGDVKNDEILAGTRPTGRGPPPPPPPPGTPCFHCFELSFFLPFFFPSLDRKTQFSQSSLRLPVSSSSFLSVLPFKMAAPGGAPFDFSALSSVLNDPSIREMAESIANNPAFASMTQSLQASLLGGGGAAAAGGGGEGALSAAGGAAAAPGAPGVPPIDPSKYAEVMSSVMGNPDFLTMAEKLGKQIMAVRFLFLFLFLRLCRRRPRKDSTETRFEQGIFGCLGALSGLDRTLRGNRDSIGPMPSSWRTQQRSLRARNETRRRGT